MKREGKELKHVALNWNVCTMAIVGVSPELDPRLKSAFLCAVFTISIVDPLLPLFSNQ